jgi:tetratricopeptide (TPR) repeat protein
MCVVALAMGTLLVVHVGCDSISAVAKDKKNQVEQHLKDATVLPRARVQLADAQKSRAELKKIADQFHIDSEVALRQIRRLDEEKDKTVEAFTKLQDAARNAGLPRLADATAEDKAKTIRIGTITLTGEDVYRELGKYRTQVETANAAIERERKQSDFLKDRADRIRAQMSRMDNNIAEMERQIADYEMYQRLLAANKTIESLGLSDDKMNELLNTDNILAELRKKIDEADVQIEMMDQRDRSTDLRDALRGPSFSITDDDLI